MAPTPLHRWGALLLLALLALTLVSPVAHAAVVAPAQSAEMVRAALVAAQLALPSDPAAASTQTEYASAAYSGDLAATIARVAPQADGRVRAALADAARAAATGSAADLAAARAAVWTGLLEGGYLAVESALRAGDGATARAWLTLREFRHATRFSRPGADATLAVSGVAAGTTAADSAIAAVRADLLDTYQARLSEALGTLAEAERQGFASRRSEAAALAAGYFAILAPAYAEQRGASAADQASAAFADLRAAALSGDALAPATAGVQAALRGFRAAPLSAQEQARRAGQLLRFLSLVPVEYGRGIRNGQVATDLEIREAITFHGGAAAAFADLRDLLEQRDLAKAEQAGAQIDALGQALAAAGAHTAVAAPAEIQRQVDDLDGLLRQLMPEEWQRQDSGADFDVIAAALDQMEQAAAAGEYELAESARVEAYAILESGPEARLTAFAPEYVQPIEDLFWYGSGDRPGLAALIQQRADIKQVAAGRAALDTQLAAAQDRLGGDSAPFAVGTNAAVIVFREGLEAVLILASLMGSLKIGASRRLRTPLWWGAAAAMVATALTWMVARGALTMLARYGEKLEAVVSLVAIAVLLLITNWFFHDVYWKGWMANFHQQKRRIMGGSASQWLGLAVLGFTSIYREGFETVLFLQALVLESGPGAVLAGVAVGLALTMLIGVIVFVIQAKLPHKKMLIATGIMIGAVLLVMVGNTAHAFQVVGWLSVHPIRWLQLPYWSGMWFGLYATWEGVLLQAAAAVFVIGSYFLAERLHQRPQPTASRQATA
jgi:high-affinity iron transporter